LVEALVYGSNFIKDSKVNVMKPTIIQVSLLAVSLLYYTCTVFLFFCALLKRITFCWKMIVTTMWSSYHFLSLRWRATKALVMLAAVIMEVLLVDLRLLLLEPLFML
jgi:hypothetical protein